MGNEIPTNHHVPTNGWGNSLTHQTIHRTEMAVIFCIMLIGITSLMFIRSNEKDTQALNSEIHVIKAKSVDISEKLRETGAELKSTQRALYRIEKKIQTEKDEE